MGGWGIGRGKVRWFEMAKETTTLRIEKRVENELGEMADPPPPPRGGGGGRGGGRGGGGGGGGNGGGGW